MEHVDQAQGAGSFQLVRVPSLGLPSEEEVARAYPDEADPNVRNAVRLVAHSLFGRDWLFSFSDLAPRHCCRGRYDASCPVGSSYYIWVVYLGRSSAVLGETSWIKRHHQSRLPPRLHYPERQVVRRKCSSMAIWRSASPRSRPTGRRFRTARMRSSLSPQAPLGIELWTR
jgi:hypothetical protein